jgi:UDP:flavonoid glycosyltransferase YjiC (YdhE family)
MVCVSAAMRILISTWGWRSHFYCLVPLGWALQAAGHEVRVASHPSMVEPITAAGLAAVPLGADIRFAEVFADQIGKVGRLDAIAADDGLEPAITADGGVVRFADALLDELVAFGHAYRPDLMIWEPFNLAAPIAAAALGVPGVQQLWGPDSSVTLRLDRESVIGPLAGRHGLSAAQVQLAGTLTLDPVPAPMQVPLTEPRLPVRYVPYNGPAVLPGWLRRTPERPRVCVTAGTMMAGAGLASDLTGVLRAVAELDVEVVAVLEPVQQQRLGALPGNVRLADAPLALRLLLPTCAALVQQGGAGTTMTALACGVPQLVLPQVSDQHFNGERLAVSGAGTVLTEPEPAAVRKVVGELIGDGSWRDAAAAMRDRIRQMPPPAAVLPELPALASRRYGESQEPIHDE